ncbi:MAG: hypothetical protein A2919_02115 [Candidatus Spechtbacteria bacterium RIFCSPLOWO2_01_FULL_43_12]|uniref:Uncharacterized protein n=1 Tax=Candidatus Spechtbacteria bacterium RIFCSPLOWO2_01_FULL_43_12 TaxID=1802162 RepID=A0A1G2HEI9_9BACT|nr:MAG: hypothetical protein A2919_02115 [Candidatus Spechtbacteria bacterium RIFCSPLOWO2_01_FULL_43_12]
MDEQMDGGIYIASIIAFKKVEVLEEGRLVKKAQPAHAVKCFEADSEKDAIFKAFQSARNLWPDYYGWFGHHAVVMNIDSFLDEIFDDFDLDDGDDEPS